jgi:hypothetical protein
MTNNPTIDGVSLLPCPFCGQPGRSDSGFGLCESINYAWCTNQDCFLSDGVDMGVTLENWNTPRAPAGDRQPLVLPNKMTPSGYDSEGSIGLRQGWNDFHDAMGKLGPLYTTPPELAALQSTIAQLEAEAMYAAAGYQAARARIEELESGRGEPVAIVVSKYGDPEAFGAREILIKADLSLIPYDTPLYTSPPAPVAVVLPERRTPEHYHARIGMCGAADMLAEEWNACLDATAALNNSK